MTSKTEICNLALSHLGQSKEIADVDTESSPGASAGRRYYDICRDTVLRDFDWPFATKFADLGLIESDPNSEWDYSYRYPSDCLKLRRILSGTRNDSYESKVRYKVGRDSSGRLLFTDEQNAEIEYTEKVTNPGHYPPDFIMALSYKLAFLMAPRITRGDPFKLGQAAFQNYNMMINDAASNSNNEEVADKKLESEFIRARD